MTVLQATMLLARRGAHAVGALFFALIFGALVASGFFRPELEGAPPISRIAVVALWVLVFGWRGHERLRADRAGHRPSVARDLELGLLLVVLTYGVVELAGGIEGAFYPLVYVLVAFLVSFLPWKAALVLVLASLGLEGIVLLVPWTTEGARTLAVHGGFIVFFALLNVVFTRTEIVRLRFDGKKRVEEELSKAEQTARDYRLLAAPSGQALEGLAPGEQDRRRVLSAVMEVRQSVYFALDVLKKSLALNTVALLWLDGRGGLKIAELISDTDDIAPGPFHASPGVLGAALASGKTVNLHHLRGQLADIPYYRTPGRVASLLAVPIMEGGITRGIICADRIDDEAFGKRDEAALRAAALHVLRAAENERVFVALEQSKSEQSKLYKASEALGSSLTETEAIDAVLGAARGIACYDFAAVTLYDPDTKRHRVIRAVGECAESVEGLAFADNAGLASMAVKNRHYLPYRGDFDPKHQVVYTKKARLKGMESLLILPLVSHDAPLGSLTLAATAAGVFSDTVRRTLQVLTNQMATSVSNARMVKKLEEMATTDGLTGLRNHRVFQEELERKLKSAERFGHPLSVILTDLDKFKLVNDTYGHPVGDVVLKGFSKILENQMRETDLVARYGGEEFAIICEQTEAQGAENLANRIREDLAAQVFHSDIGKFQVTCSLGIATYPRHARDKKKLVESADQALYAAKEHGRNRAEVHRGGASASAPPPAPATTKPKKTPKGKMRVAKKKSSRAAT